MPPLTPLTPIDTPSPRVIPPPRVELQPRVDDPNEPVAHRTISHQPISSQAASSRIYPSQFLEKWALSEESHPTQALAVLDPDSGNYVEHRKLRRHPHLVPIWNTSSANELGCFYQGIGTIPPKKTNGSKAHTHSTLSTTTTYPSTAENKPHTLKLCARSVPKNKIPITLAL